MQFVIPVPPRVSVEVVGGDARFPVRRVYCVGRNYLAHIREMGSDERQPPFFFQKPADALLASGSTFPYPPCSQNVQHEIELVVAIGQGGASIATESALDHVFGYGVGIDMTRRDLQAQAKKAGQPWMAGKAFDHGAPISPLTPVNQTGHPAAGRIWLAVNGEVRQDSDLKLQIWNVPEIIANLSTLFELAPGDLIYTGTPEGVGPVRPSDVMTGGIDGIGEIAITVA